MKEKEKDFKAPQNLKNTMLRLFKYLKPYKQTFYLVLVFSLLSTVFSIAGPKILGKGITKIGEGYSSRVSVEKLQEQKEKLNILASNKKTNTSQVQQALNKVNSAINHLGGGVDFSYIAKIVFILIALYVISAVFSYLQEVFMNIISQKMIFDMRNDVENKLSRLPLKYFDSTSHGEIQSRVINDIDNISNALQQSLIQLITSVVTIIGVIIMMFTISVALTFIVIATLPFYAIFTIKIAKKSQNYFKMQQDSLGEVNGHVEEMFSGHEIVKAYGYEDESMDRFNQINDKLYDSSWKAQFVSGIILPFMRFLSNLAYIIICVVGGIFVTHNRINLGDMISFIQYSKQFTMPIIQAAAFVSIIQSTIASAERIFQILDEAEEIPDSSDSKIIQLTKGEVCFEDVNFSYSKENPLISGMDIEVKAGHTIAIVGPTGAGKTTLVNLLMRFYEIDSGRITIDGVDIRDIRRGDLRKIFGMVLQDTWLFNGTIRDNIRYGREDASEEEIIDAAKAAHAHYFIRTLPEGYNTVINEEASNISAGQKQLITIARAILANPSIMILDEATSNVDSRTEVYIQKAMTELMADRTSFVIAHRLSTIREAELILVMNKGAIVEVGNHYELLKKDGFYANLYNSQFVGADLEEKIV